MLLIPIRASNNSNDTIKAMRTPRDVAATGGAGAGLSEGLMTRFLWEGMRANGLHQVELLYADWIGPAASSDVFAGFLPHYDRLPRTRTAPGSRVTFTSHRPS